MDKNEAYNIVINDLQEEREALLERLTAGEDVNEQGQEVSKALIFLIFRQAGLNAVFNPTVIVE